jgi:hypothetical protein
MKQNPGPWLMSNLANPRGRTELRGSGHSDPYARYGNFISVESNPSFTEAEGFFSTGSWAVTGD